MSSSVNLGQNRNAQSLEVREFLIAVGSFWQTAKKITLAREAIEQFSRAPICENPEERLAELGVNLMDAVSQTDAALKELQKKYPLRSNNPYPSLAGTHEVTDFREAWNEFGLPADCNPF